MKLQLVEEIARNQWAMTIPAFRSILAVVDREELDEKQASYLHSMDVNTKTEMVANFGESYPDSRYASQLNNVGFLPVYGPTTPRAGLFQRASGVASYDALMSDFKLLEADNSIDTIALMFDTPGGSVTGNSDWADVIKNSSKRTVAYTWMAASAGYWAASAADKIYAPATATLGSIGTVMTLLDSSKADEKKGIQKYEIVSSQSPLKRGSGDDVQQAQQELVDGLADVFINAVAANRNTTAEKVINDYGKGYILVAAKALEAGMIDGIMGVNEFVNQLVDTSNTSTFYMASAQADITAEGNDMNKPVSNEAPLTADQLKQAYPSAVMEIKQSAIDAEHTRLQSLEAMAKQYDGQSPQVREAVRGVIDARKYDTASTVGTLGGDVFAAANNAMQAQLKQLSKQHDEGNEAAKHTAEAKNDVLPKPKNQVDEETTVANLVAANKALGGN